MRLSAEQELEKLQARVYAGLGMPPPAGSEATDDPLSEFETDIMVQFLSQWFGVPTAEILRDMGRGQARRRGLRPPTRFEHPVVYTTMRIFADQIERAAARNSYPSGVPLSRPVFGTLPSGQVDALWQATLSGDRSLVLIHSGLFPFADLMSRVVTRAFASAGRGVSWEEDHVRAHLARDRFIEDRFRQVLESYLVAGRMDRIGPSLGDAPLDGPRIVLATILTQGMGLFVIGHEYGHVVQGPARARRAAAVVGGAEMDTLRFGWDDELAADRVGVVLAYLGLEKPERPDREFTGYLASIEFFFRTLELVERGASVIACGAEDRLRVSDHPPTAQRRDAIRRELREFLRRQRPTTYSDRAWQAAVTEVRGFERVMEILWERASPALLQHYHRGVQLAPNWRTYRREEVKNECAVEKVSVPLAPNHSGVVPGVRDRPAEAGSVPVRRHETTGRAKVGVRELDAPSQERLRARNGTAP